jgi:hypothetical protein
MDVIQSPSLASDTLGWARVVCAVAADPTAERLSARLKRWVDEHGPLQKARPSDAVKLASELRFVDEHEGLTDLGRVLVEVDSATGDDLFNLTVQARWMLWFAIARADGLTCRAVLRTWQPGASVEDRRRAVAEAHPNQELAGIGESLTRYTKLRLRRPESLGWGSDEVLTRLQAWANNAPDEWADADILRGFAAAEGLAVRPPSIARLETVLAAVPDGLLTPAEPERRAAPESAVRHLAIVDGLANGELEDWFAIEVDGWWHQMGVTRVAGATTQDTILSWPRGPRAVTVAAQEPPPPRTERPRLDPPTLTLSPSDLCARAWLRYVAWWLRGPTAASVLLGHHLPRKMVVDTVRRWAGEESARWQDRSRSVLNVSPPNIVGQLGSEAAKHVVAALNKRGVHVVALLNRVAEEDLSPEWRTTIEAWLDQQNVEWSKVESATACLLGRLVDRGSHTREDLRTRLRDHREAPARAARAYLATLFEPPEREPITVECDLLVRASNAVRAAVEGRQPSDFSLMFLEGDVVGHLTARAVRELPALEGSAHLAAQKLHSDAVAFLITLARDASQAVWCSAFDAEYARIGRNDVLDGLGLVAANTADEGWGFWEKREWFEPRDSKGLPQSFRPAGAAELQTADRLMHLWLGIEEAVGAGDSWSAVVEPLSKAAAAAWASAAVDDAIEVSALVGPQLPRPPTWASLREEWPQESDCAFVRERLDLVHTDYGAKKNALRLFEDTVRHAVWVFKSVNDVRNRVVHTGWREPFEARAELERTYENALVVWSWLEQIKGADGWDALTRPYDLSVPHPIGDFELWRRKP